MTLKRLLQFAAWPTAAGVIIALLAMLVFPQLRGQHTSTSSSNEDDEPVSSYADAVSRAAPAVVNIYTQKTVVQRNPRYTNDPYYRQLYKNSDVPQRTLGSGVIVDPQGFILTNNHVINGADKIAVLLNDGRNASAELIGVDTENDLAVLKINLDKLHAITPKSSSTIRVGDVVLAIGNPFGVGQSVSQGIVSATGRWGLGINSNENFIQTDAAINPGNSGGALIDAKGNLIGINTAVLDQTGTSSGISFAVPAEIAINSLRQVVEYGEVRRGWLGLSARPLNEKGVKLFGTPGLIVGEVEPDSPAEKAGVLVDDVIVKINEISFVDGILPERNLHAVHNLLGGLKPGAEIRLLILREGKRLEIKAIAGTRPTQATKT